jgi:hypothetical protein
MSSSVPPFATTGTVPFLGHYAAAILPGGITSR